VDAVLGKLVQQLHILAASETLICLGTAHGSVQPINCPALLRSPQIAAWLCIVSQARDEGWV